MNSDPTAAPEVPESRLRWMCRRGMKELDVLLTRYLERRYAAADPAQQAAFVSLLQDAEDPDLWAWVMGYAPVPPAYADVVARLVDAR